MKLSNIRIYIAQLCEYFLIFLQKCFVFKYFLLHLHRKNKTTHKDETSEHKYK